MIIELIMIIITISVYKVWRDASLMNKYVVREQVRVHDFKRQF